jgi:hypothetical protein
MSCSNANAELVFVFLSRVRWPDRDRAFVTTCLNLPVNYFCLAEDRGLLAA